MDTITHGLVGVVCARMGVRQRFGVAAGRMFVLSTVLPDVDAVTRFVSPISSLEHHRGITHSIFGAALIALILAAAAHWLWRAKPFIKLWAVFYLGVLSHIFLDLLTSFGTLILAPFSRTRYSLDALFIIDLAFTGICVATIVLTRKKVEAPRSLRRARLGGVVLAGYVALALVNRQIALASFRAEHPQGRQYAVEALPHIPSVFNWMGVVRVPGGYDTASTFLLGRRPPVFRHVASQSQTPLAQTAGNLRLVKLYYWFARFPVVIEQNSSRGAELKIYDLRFTAVPRRDPPFVMRVFFNGAGEPSSIWYRNQTFPAE